MNETPVTVVGNIASEVRARRVGVDGQFVVGFRVASSERRWDRANEAWTDGDRFAVWVTCWRRLGEHVRGSLAKGDPVIVTGRLSVREYEVNGERRYSTDLAAAAVGPDLARCRALVTRPRPASAEPESTGETAAESTAGSDPTGEGRPPCEVAVAEEPATAVRMPERSGAGADVASTGLSRSEQPDEPEAGRLDDLPATA